MSAPPKRLTICINPKENDEITIAKTLSLSNKALNKKPLISISSINPMQSALIDNNNICPHEREISTPKTRGTITNSPNGI